MLAKTDLIMSVGVQDFADPSTHLWYHQNHLVEKVLKTYLGFDLREDNVAAKSRSCDYEKLVTEAGDEATDVAKRYDKYAAAQAWLTDSAFDYPHLVARRPILSKIYHLQYHLHYQK